MLPEVFRKRFWSSRPHDTKGSIFKKVTHENKKHGVHIFEFMCLAISKDHGGKT